MRNQTIHYPSFLEKWWLKKAREWTHETDDVRVLRAFEKSVAKLSDSFTIERSRTFGYYTKSRESVYAYGLFFFPQTFIRTCIVLNELFCLYAQQKPHEPVHIVDFGAGSGAASLATVLILQQKLDNPAIHVTALDTSAEMLHAFKLLVEHNKHHFKQCTWTFLQHDFRKPLPSELRHSSATLLIMSFSLGEAFYRHALPEITRWLENLRELVTKPGWILILEPALKETSERLEKLRDLIIKKGLYFVWSPCPHHFRCPLLHDGRYWCHQVRSWSPPESLVYLNRKLFRSIHVLKFSYLLLGTSPPPVQNQEYYMMRITSPVSRTKGKYLFTGCLESGEHAQFEILTRYLTQNDHNFFKQLERGDILWYSPASLRSLKHGYRLAFPGGIVRHFSPTNGFSSL